MERLKLAEMVQATPFAAIISDGSTDSSVCEQEMMFMRMGDHGQVKVKFVGVIETPKADAERITKSIMKGVEVGLDIKFEDFVPKLVAMGCDEAAVMIGRNTGVVKRLRDLAPSMVGIHCFAHRLELAIKDVIKKHQHYAQLEKLMFDLWQFYKNRYV